VSSIYRADTISALIESGKDEAQAIGAPERPPLTFGALRSLAGRTVASLNAMGIGRNDRVAIVLPNGPEMAASFVAIACGGKDEEEERMNRRRPRLMISALRSARTRMA
jgi:acyl-CoA synthetase (AMP-forming)/AMP-acid ligase II